MTEKIISKDGQLVWDVIDKVQKQEPSGVKQAYFTVACSSCGYRRIGRKHDLRNRKTCPGCSKKPPAVKTDDTGLCISICEVGVIEYIKNFQEQHGVSEREAVRTFVETARAHLSEEDPIRDSLTEEGTRAKVRRGTGRKKDYDRSLSQNLGRTAPLTDSSLPNTEPVQPTYEQLKKYSETTGPLYFADLAILQLERISNDDPTAKEAIGKVIEWCHQKLEKIRV